MTEQTQQSGKKKASRPNEFIGFRCPKGWRDAICEKAGTDNISEAVTMAVASYYGLKYKKLDSGRKPTKFAVDVTTPHSAELVEAVFAAFVQPWAGITSKKITVIPELDRTFVSCKSGDIVANSEETGRTRGIELAREIAKEIDDAAAEAIDDEADE